jgi:glutathione S-transferase
MAARRLYDLAGKEEEHRFSPYCWRARMALAHKGLEVETVPWRFTEKEAIAFSGQGTVPVLVDGDRTIADSWAIALYLDEAYPDRPVLFDGPQGRAAALFVRNWCVQVVHPLILRIVIMDLFNGLHEKDKAYFRETRERRFGMPLEEVAADRDGHLKTLRGALEPLRATLAETLYLGGNAPDYADYIAFGAFQWARAVSPIRLLEADDPIAAWRTRLLDRFDGLARRAPAYDA